MSIFGVSTSLETDSFESALNTIKKIEGAKEYLSQIHAQNFINLIKKENTKSIGEKNIEDLQESIEKSLSDYTVEDLVYILHIDNAKYYDEILSNKEAHINDQIQKEGIGYKDQLIKSSLDALTQTQKEIGKTPDIETAGKTTDIQVDESKFKENELLNKIQESRGEKATQVTDIDDLENPVAKSAQEYLQNKTQQQDKTTTKPEKKKSVEKENNTLDLESSPNQITDDEQNAFNQRESMKYQLTASDIDLAAPYFIKDKKKISIAETRSISGLKTVMVKAKQDLENDIETVGVFNTNDQGSHWVAYKIQKNSQGDPQLYYKDSLGTKRQSFEDEFLNIFKDSNIEILQEGDKEQKDGVSCGVFALKNMAIMAEEDLSNKEAGNLKFFNPGKDEQTYNKTIKQARAGLGPYIAQGTINKILGDSIYSLVKGEVQLSNKSLPILQTIVQKKLITLTSEELAKKLSVNNPEELQTMIDEAKKDNDLASKIVNSLVPADIAQSAEVDTNNIESAKPTEPNTPEKRKFTDRDIEKHKENIRNDFEGLKNRQAQALIDIAKSEERDIILSDVEMLKKAVMEAKQSDPKNKAALQNMVSLRGSISDEIKKYKKETNITQNQIKDLETTHNELMKELDVEMEKSLNDSQSAKKLIESYAIEQMLLSNMPFFGKGKAQNYSGIDSDQAKRLNKDLIANMKLPVKSMKAIYNAQIKGAEQKVENDNSFVSRLSKLVLPQPAQGSSYERMGNIFRMRIAESLSKEGALKEDQLMVNFDESKLNPQVINELSDILSKDMMITHNLFNNDPYFATLDIKNREMVYREIGKGLQKLDLGYVEANSTKLCRDLSVALDSERGGFRKRFTYKMNVSEEQIKQAVNKWLIGGEYVDNELQKIEGRNNHLKASAEYQKKQERILEQEPKVSVEKEWETNIEKEQENRVQKGLQKQPQTRERSNAVIDGIPVASSQSQMQAASAIQENFDRPLDGVYESTPDISKARADFLHSQIYIMKFAIESMRGNEQMDAEIQKLGNKIALGVSEKEGKPAIIPNDSIIQALADPEKREIISKIMDAAIFEKKIEQRMAMTEEQMHKIMVNTIGDSMRDIEWLEKKDQKSNIVSRIFDVADETGKKLCSLNESIYTKPLKILTSDKQKLDIKSYRTIDFALEAEGSASIVIVGKDMSGMNVTKSQADKAYYLNVNYDDSGRLASLIHPEPIKFAGKGDDAPAYFERDGEVYTLAITKGKYHEMRKQIAVNRGIAFKLEKNNELASDYILAKKYEGPVLVGPDANKGEKQVMDANQIDSTQESLSSAPGQGVQQNQAQQDSQIQSEQNVENNIEKNDAISRIESTFANQEALANVLDELGAQFDDLKKKKVIVNDSEKDLAESRDLAQEIKSSDKEKENNIGRKRSNSAPNIKIGVLQPAGKENVKKPGSNNDERGSGVTGPKSGRSSPTR